MLVATTGAAEAKPVQALTPEELIAAQALIRRVPVGESVVEAILRLVRGGRPESTEDETVRRHVAWGPGPRAAQALMLACARPRAAGRPAGAERGGHRRPRPAGAAPPHGAQFLRPRRRRGAGRRDRPPGRAHRMSVPPRPAFGPPRRGARRPPAAAAGGGRAGGGDGGAGRAWPAPGRPGRQLLAVPPLPGRRRRPAGSTGGNPPAPTAPMCARPSGKRRRPWCCGATARPACSGGRGRRPPTKIERAGLLTLALAALLLRGGERVSLLAPTSRTASGRGRPGAAGRRAGAPSPKATACRPRRSCRGMRGWC